MSGWITHAPVGCQVSSLHSPLRREYLKVAKEIAEAVGECKITSISIRPFQPNGGLTLGSITQLVPEISVFYTALTSHPMKSVVCVDDSVNYEKPIREGLIIKHEKSWYKHPHIVFTNAHEAIKFKHFGTATLAIVISSGGIKSTMTTLIDLARAINSGRIERVIFVTEEGTSLQDRYHIDRVLSSVSRPRGAPITIGYGELTM